MNVGKSSTHFFEKAAELKNTVLTNKKLQTTRFVRALLRGITAALRNLPTMIAVIDEDYEEAVLTHDNTRAKELNATLNQLRNAEILFFSIGMAQILEIYCGVSLEVQHASHLPIQAWPRIDSAKSELQSLSNTWIWKNRNLKMAGIGNPDILIKDVLGDGVFKPFVPLACIKKSSEDTSDTVTAFDGDDDEIDLFEENEPFLEPAGSLPMINANQTTLEKVVKKLEDVTRELLDCWNRRQVKTKLQETTLEAFGKIHNTDSPQSVEKMIELLNNVASALPPDQRESINVQECYPGFLEWNTFWLESFRDAKVKKPDLEPLQDVHIYYENWVKKMKESNNNSYVSFQKLWELVMIRSSSEALCETVGSIMNQHSGKNRYLEPENFSKEIVLRFNLGPMHLLEDLVGEVLAMDTAKFYLRKEIKIGRVVTNDLNKSSAMATFQKKNEKKSRFPNSFWIYNSK